MHQNFSFVTVTLNPDGPLRISSFQSTNLRGEADGEILNVDASGQSVMLFLNHLQVQELTEFLLTLRTMRDAGDTTKLQTTMDGEVILHEQR